MIRYDVALIAAPPEGQFARRFCRSVAPLNFNGASLPRRVHAGTSIKAPAREELGMDASRIELLTFAIWRERIGIPLADVREIVRAVSIARLPNAPQVVEGVVNVRGTIVPVLDIRARFNLPPKAVEPSDHLVIAFAKRQLVAIRADRVADLMVLERSDVEDLTVAVPGSNFVAGVAKLSDGLLLIHDLATFLSVTEAEALDRLEERMPL
jgi:purine-binding chemotaxis protein CheW